MCAATTCAHACPSKRTRFRPLRSRGVPLPASRSAVVGELDEDLDANLDLSAIMAAPLKTVGH